MSEPSVICQHEKVVRRGDKWYCDWCEAEFVHFDPYVPAEVRVMEPTPTLRDQFAMAALTGNWSETQPNDNEKMAEWAYAVADAMMKARTA